MKRYKDLFEKICSFENLHFAYLKARKCKRYRPEILKFSYHLEENLLRIKEELENQTYQHSGYREFIVCDSKKRRIKAAPFKDRVIHHALCNLIEPIFDKGFIYDSYACRKGKGTHRAVKRLEKFLKTISDSVGGATIRKIFCLKCDVSKYFESINHEILLHLIEKRIGDKKVIWLIKEILDSSYDKKPGTGIPIGNLTSQLFANIYLNELDQFVKHQLRVKYYIRYMDDFLILGTSKRKLHRIKEEIREFLRKNLELELHPKKANVFPTNQGIDFLGYRVYGKYRLLRKSTVKRFIRKIKKEKFNKQSIQSWLGYAKFANSWRLRQKLSQKFQLCLIQKVKI